MAARYLPKSVRRWHMVGDTRCNYIGSGGLLPKPRPYPKWSDETAYRLPFTARLVTPTSPHVMPTSLPNRPRVSTPPATTPSCLPHHQSPWTTHRPPRHSMTSCWRHPTLTPPDDVMLTSSKFSCQDQKAHIWPNFAIFAHFSVFSALPPACIFTSFAAANLPRPLQSCCRPAFDCNRAQKSPLNQVFSNSPTAHSVSSCIDKKPVDWPFSPGKLAYFTFKPIQSAFNRPIVPNYTSVALKETVNPQFYKPTMQDSISPKNSRNYT